MRTPLDEIKRDLLNLAYILEESDILEQEDEEKSKFQKEVDGDTTMFDCDAENCRFWNEGFKSNCTLFQVEIDAQHGCAQFEKKESLENSHSRFMEIE